MEKNRQRNQDDMEREQNRQRDKDDMEREQNRMRTQKRNHAGRRGIRWICSMTGTVWLLLLAAFAAIGGRGFAVTSGSMTPACRQGDLIGTVPVRFDALKTGDVITYRPPESDVSVTHRVIRVEKRTRVLYTKGDANEMEDTFPVSDEEIIGKVWFRIPYLGYLCMLPAEVLRILLIGVCLLLLVCMISRPSRTAEDRERQQNNREETARKTIHAHTARTGKGYDFREKERTAYCVRG